MFIITAVMTIPVGIAGIFIWPGTPSKPNKLFLTEAELDLASKRLLNHTPEPENHATNAFVPRLRKIFTDWKVYLLTFWAILFWNSGSSGYGAYLLWLKSLKRYTPAQVNQLGATSPAVGIFYVLFINFSSDLFLGRTGAITLAHAWNFTGMVILAIWDVPEPAKWLAFNATYASVAMSSVLYGWANDLLRHDTKERSIVLVVMNIIAQSTTAWTPLFVFKTVEGPSFRKGHAFCATSSFLLVAYTFFVIRRLHFRQE
jgi:hypothetical protein